jgi:hypothetical protein
MRRGTLPGFVLRLQKVPVKSPLPTVAQTWVVTSQMFIPVVSDPGLATIKAQRAWREGDQCTPSIRASRGPSPA